MNDDKKSTYTILSHTEHRIHLANITENGIESLKLHFIYEY